eukprot:TRINITY_DN3467_c0_g1_i1.p3 TRINITY_DN3467_c0_g1~~TRINITY_DN3467_c0_g1_i1.p3  ORF type:complete len:149 (-),score=27.69 TRINITY_DN3467_c0_g1_i1:221-667(-)
MDTPTFTNRSFNFITKFKMLCQSFTTRRSFGVIVASGAKKVDIKRQGLESIKNDTVQRNLKGVSKFMDKKDWVDASGRKGSGKGVYKFASKYGANVDGYSPIFTPDIWAEGGDTYKLGAKGLVAWAGLVVVLLAVGVVLIVQTSQIGA